MTHACEVAEACNCPYERTISQGVLLRSKVAMSFRNHLHETKQSTVKRAMPWSLNSSWWCPYLYCRELESKGMWLLSQTTWAPGMSWE